jgi:Tfp pilus assembly major pilin PilA
MSYIGLDYYDENRNRKQYYYQCTPSIHSNADDWNQPGNRAGDFTDGDGKFIGTAAQLKLKGDYNTQLKNACQNIYTFYNNYKKTFCANPKNKTNHGYKWLCPQETPQPQVAAATTTKVTAPNPVSDADVADTQKRAAEVKAKREQANIDLKKLMDSPMFLRTTDSDGYTITDKTTLDAQVKELVRVLANGANPIDRIDKQDLLRSMNNVIKAFPEYGETLKSYIYQLQ